MLPMRSLLKLFLSGAEQRSPVVGAQDGTGALCTACQPLSSNPPALRLSFAETVSGPVHWLEKELEECGWRSFST